MIVKLFHSKKTIRIKKQEVLENILSISTTSRKFQTDFLFESITIVQKELCLWFDDIISCFICKPEEYFISEDLKVPYAPCVTRIELCTAEVLHVFLANFEEEEYA